MAALDVCWPAGHWTSRAGGGVSCAGRRRGMEHRSLSEPAVSGSRGVFCSGVVQLLDGMHGGRLLPAAGRRGCPGHEHSRRALEREDMDSPVNARFACGSDQRPVRRVVPPCEPLYGRRLRRRVGTAVRCPLRTPGNAGRHLGRKGLAARAAGDAHRRHWSRAGCGLVLVPERVHRCRLRHSPGWQWARRAGRAMGRDQLVSPADQPARVTVLADRRVVPDDRVVHRGRRCGHRAIQRTVVTRRLVAQSSPASKWRDEREHVGCRVRIGDQMHGGRQLLHQHWPANWAVGSSGTGTAGQVSRSPARPVR